jgi:hypothetical protein
MKIKIITGILISILLLTFSCTKKETMEEKKIKEMVEKCYFNGAFNDFDTKSMAEGFHPEFAMLFPEKDNAIDKYKIADWISDIEKRKLDPKFDPTSRKLDGKVVSLDITGKAATAKIELSRRGVLIYTDYMFLLKFENNWKIISKIYHEHSSL